jgi:hypothetical protein
MVDDIAVAAYNSGVMHSVAVLTKFCVDRDMNDEIVKDLWEELNKLTEEVKQNG